jgi:hypothetical protein
MKNASLLCCAVLAWPLGLAATQTNDAAGSQAAPWLTLSNNSRQSAMGDVVAAVADDVNGVGEAPAALAQVQGQQVAAGENLWLQNVNLAHFAYGASLFDGGAFGVAVNYQDFGTIDLYSVNGGALVSNGTTHPEAYDVDLGWGQKLGWGLSAGVDAKTISQNLDGDASNTVGFDASAAWDSGVGLKLGVAGQNFGPQLAGSDLPTNFAIGAAYGFGLPNPYTIAVDVDAPTQGDVTVAVGAETWIQSLLALRVGYHSNNVGTTDLSVSGLTAGLGLKVAWLNVDYAYRADGDLGMANEFSVKADF